MQYWKLFNKIQNTTIIDNNHIVKTYEIIVLLIICILLASIFFVREFEMTRFIIFILCYYVCVYIFQNIWIKRAIKEFGNNFSDFIYKEKLKAVKFFIIFHNITLTDEQIRLLIDSYNKNEGKSILNSPIIDIIFQILLIGMLKDFNPPSFILFLTYLPIFSILKLKKEKNNDFLLMLNWYKMLRDDLKKQFIS